ncbi:hypothetical protein TNCV_4204011 [Trichonephila clavipes]|nr:hypothetical protein TNCV_4204011 [Trichonephila clavipes]
MAGVAYGWSAVDLSQGACHGSSVVKVIDSWQACHEFEPSVAFDPPRRRGRSTLNMSRLKRPPVGVVWKLGEVSKLWCRSCDLTTIQSYEALRQKP